MTTLRCGKHNLSFSTDHYKSCPICDVHALHPDPEEPISALREALDGLYTKRWADAIGDEYQEELSLIAKASHELVQAIGALNNQIDWPAEKRATVVSHNHERLGSAA